MTEIKKNQVDQTSEKSEDYWREMYDELEEQMENMMTMTLELIDRELYKQASDSHKGKFRVIEPEPNVPPNFEKEYRRLQLFEHSIKVTFIGKIALTYIKAKKRLRKIIKGK